MLFISKDLELCAEMSDSNPGLLLTNQSYNLAKFCLRLQPQHQLFSLQILCQDYIFSFFFLLNQGHGERLEPGTSCFTSLTLYQQATCIISYLYYFFNFNSTLTNNFSVLFIPPCFVFPHSFHLVLFLSFLLLLFPPLSVFLLFLTFPLFRLLV